MKVSIGQGQDRIVDVINYYRGTNLGQWTRAMYRKLMRPKCCLWFPQCSPKQCGTADKFKRTLSARNWIPYPRDHIYELPINAAFAQRLNLHNGDVRITFANIIPKKGYEFVGVFEYVGTNKKGVREYKMIQNATDSSQW